jgi:hypothetical protein
MALKGKTLCNSKVPAKKKTTLPPANIETQGRGFEEPTDREDLLIPRASLLQALSPQVSEGIDGCKAGVVVNSISNTVLPDRFIPIFKYTEYLKFNPRDKKDDNFDPAYEPGQMIWKITDKADPRVAETKFAEDGSKPTAQKVMNFLCFFPGEPMPIVLGFSKTSYKAGKKLISLAQLSGGDMFSRVYQLQVKQADKEGIKYFVLDVALVGKASKEEFAVAENLYNRFRGKDLQVHEPEKKEEAAE